VTYKQLDRISQSTSKKQVNDIDADPFELKWEKSSRRMRPVVDVGIEQTDAEDADDYSQIDDGEHKIDGRRDLRT